MSKGDLAQLILEHRRLHHVSQSGFARQCGLSAGTIGKLELQEVTPDLRTLIQLAGGLGQPVEEILRIDQGLPSLHQPIRRGSLTYRLVQLFREEAVDWQDLAESDRTCLLGFLRQIVTLENRLRRKKR